MDSVLPVCTTQLPTQFHSNSAYGVARESNDRHQPRALGLTGMACPMSEAENCETLARGCYQSAWNSSKLRTSAPHVSTDDEAFPEWRSCHIPKCQCFELQVPWHENDKELPPGYGTVVTQGASGLLLEWTLPDRDEGLSYADLTAALSERRHALEAATNTHFMQIEDTFKKVRKTFDKLNWKRNLNLKHPSALGTNTCSASPQNVSLADADEELSRARALHVEKERFEMQNKQLGAELARIQNREVMILDEDCEEGELGGLSRGAEAKAERHSQDGDGKEHAQQVAFHDREPKGALSTAVAARKWDAGYTKVDLKQLNCEYPRNGGRGGRLSSHEVVPEVIDCCDITAEKMHLELAGDALREQRENPSVSGDTRLGAMGGERSLGDSTAGRLVVSLPEIGQSPETGQCRPTVSKRKAKGGKGRTKKPRVLLKPRLLLRNTLTGRLVGGAALPTRTPLEQYLKEHPHMVVCAEEERFGAGEAPAGQEHQDVEEAQPGSASGLRAGEPEKESCASGRMLRWATGTVGHGGGDSDAVVEAAVRVEGQRESTPPQERKSRGEGGERSERLEVRAAVSEAGEIPAARVDPETEVVDDREAVVEAVVHDESQRENTPPQGRSSGGEGGEHSESLELATAVSAAEQRAAREEVETEAAESGNAIASAPRDDAAKASDGVHTQGPDASVRQRPEECSAEIAAAPEFHRPCWSCKVKKQGFNMCRNVKQHTGPDWSGETKSKPKGLGARPGRREHGGHVREQETTDSAALAGLQGVCENVKMRRRTAQSSPFGTPAASPLVSSMRSHSRSRALGAVHQQEEEHSAVAERRVGSKSIPQTASGADQEERKRRKSAAQHHGQKLWADAMQGQLDGFKTKCWECKAGMFQRGHYSTTQCRTLKGHKGPDWADDPRAQLQSSIVPKKTKPEKASKKQPGSAFLVPVAPRTFTTACWDCAKRTKVSFHVCRQTKKHTAVDWKLDERAGGSAPQLEGPQPEVHWSRCKPLAEQVKLEAMLLRCIRHRVNGWGNAMTAPGRHRHRVAGTPQRHLRVAVVGGGAAGLAATRQLINAGAHVTLLEARERLGGRLNTVCLKGAGDGDGQGEAKVDLGASFVHGCNEPRSNLSYTLALELQDPSLAALPWLRESGLVASDAGTPMLDRTCGGYSAGWAASPECSWYDVERGRAPERMDTQTVARVFDLWEDVLHEMEELSENCQGDYSLGEAYDMAVRLLSPEQQAALASPQNRAVMESAKVLAWSYVGEMAELSLKGNIPVESEETDEDGPGPASNPQEYVQVDLDHVWGQRFCEDMEDPSESQAVRKKASAELRPDMEHNLSDDGLVVGGYGDMVVHALQPTQSELSDVSKVSLQLGNAVRCVRVDEASGQCVVQWEAVESQKLRAGRETQNAEDPTQSEHHSAAKLPSAVSAGGKDLDCSVLASKQGGACADKSATAGGCAAQDSALPMSSAAASACDVAPPSACCAGTLDGTLQTSKTSSPQSLYADEAMAVDHEAARGKGQVVGQRKVAQFDFVVVTLPVGILDLCSKDNPPVELEVVGKEGESRSLLSSRKRRALEHIKMGVENKIVLRFKEAFWPDDRQHRYMNCTDQRFRFLNLTRYGKRGVLIAHCGPPWSKGFKDDELGSVTGTPFQRMDDTQVVREVLKVLARMFPSSQGKQEAAVAGAEGQRDALKGGAGCSSEEGEQELAARVDELHGSLVDSRVTRWDEEEWSRGSYSYLRQEYNMRHSVAMASAEPSEKAGPVFFAGEACAPPESAQCVHGALLTGRVAADNILKAWRERAQASHDSAAA